jgi:hypothetical protein
MKKTILLTLLVVSSFQNINSQEKREKDLLTSGKWYIKYMKFGENKREISDKTKNENWMLFNQNGKAEITTQGIKSIEDWNFGKKHEIINISEDGKFTEYKIEKLNESELVISRKYLNKITTLGLKK